MDWVLVIAGTFFIGIIAAAVIVAVRHRHVRDEPEESDLGDAPLNAGFMPIEAARAELAFWSCPAIENARRGIRRAWLGESDGRRIFLIEHYEVQHSANDGAGTRRGDASGLVTIKRKIASTPMPQDLPNLRIVEHTFFSRLIHSFRASGPLRSDPQLSQRWRVRCRNAAFAEQAVNQHLRRRLHDLPPRLEIWLHGGWLHLVMHGPPQPRDFEELTAVLCEIASAFEQS